MTDKISKSLRIGVGELLAESSAQPDDQASTLSAWLADLDEADRTFVLDLIKRTCNHLRDREV